MVEVHPGLFIGKADDYEWQVRGQSGWWVVQACKEPYHRKALGYSGRAAPKTHPEYLIARRDNRLILNMIDVDDPDYIPAEIIDAALDFIGEYLAAGEKVLVHCNQGMSRSPAIGMLYLATVVGVLPNGSLEEAEAAFRPLYPGYNPARGVRGFLARRWTAYVARGQRGETAH